MKKILFSLACLLPLLASCSKESDEKKQASTLEKFMYAKINGERSRIFWITPKEYQYWGNEAVFEYVCHLEFFDDHTMSIELDVRNFQMEEYNKNFRFSGDTIKIEESRYKDYILRYKFYKDGKCMLYIEEEKEGVRQDFAQCELMAAKGSWFRKE